MFQVSEDSMSNQSLAFVVPHRAFSFCGALGLLLIVGQTLVSAQASTPWTSLNRGTDNIEVLGHLPLGHDENLSDMAVEQELSRPYA